MLPCMARNPIIAVALMLAGTACDDTVVPEGTRPAGAPPDAGPSVNVAAPSPTSTSLLEAGDAAPNLAMLAHNGLRLTVADFRGQPVVAYFYPKDGTPGCTAQAEGFRDTWRDFRRAKAVVLGISTDDSVTHRAFADELDLPFLLIADPSHEVAGAFGVPVENGKAKRVTFLIDGRGRIAKVWPGVDPRANPGEVLAALRALEST